MNFLPTTLGTRPRLAVELRAEGVVAARAENAAAVLIALSRANLPTGAIAPSLKPGNIADRVAVIAALRSVLETVAEKTGGRERQITLIVPDAAMRVLLLDFDTLPSKLAEALPVVRFRLKKMLPFEAEDAAVSYQVMSTSKNMVRVVAAAMPLEVLAEYETVVREAGFEPGAVLPSTLAAIAGLEIAEAAALIVNAGPTGVTTAIVQGGILLLHRSVDLTTEEPYVEPMVSLPVDLESPYATTMEQPNAVLEGVREELRDLANQSGVHEVAQAVSVATAYFEDTLGFPPPEILSSGTIGSSKLGQILKDAGFGNETIAVQEMVEAQSIATPSSNVPRSWLAGVRGALKS